MHKQIYKQTLANSDKICYNNLYKGRWTDFDRPHPSVMRNSSVALSFRKAHYNQIGSYGILVVILRDGKSC